MGRKGQQHLGSSSAFVLSAGGRGSREGAACMGLTLAGSPAGAGGGNCSVPGEALLRPPLKCHNGAFAQLWPERKRCTEAALATTSAKRKRATT